MKKRLAVIIFCSVIFVAVFSFVFLQRAVTQRETSTIGAPKAKEIKPYDKKYDPKRRLVSTHTYVFSKDELIRKGLTENEEGKWKALMDELKQYIDAVVKRSREKWSLTGKVSKKNEERFYGVLYEVKVLWDYLMDAILALNHLFYERSEADWSRGDQATFESIVAALNKKLATVENLRKKLGSGGGKYTVILRTFLKDWLLKFLEVTYQKVLNEKMFDKQFRIGGDKIRAKIKALIIQNEQRARTP